MQNMSQNFDFAAYNLLNEHKNKYRRSRVALKENSIFIR